MFLAASRDDGPGGRASSRAARAGTARSGGGRVLQTLSAGYLVVTLFSTGLPVARAQGQPELPHLNATRISSAITVDGRLDEACWREAQVASAFHVLAAKRRAPAPAEETRCQVVFDEDALVIGIVCREPRMGDLIAKATERDGAVWHDDSVEIFLQPGPAFYYHFGVNSRGVIYDARIVARANLTEADMSEGRLWDGVWEAAVSRDAESWAVEARVPFATLDLSPQTPSVWRFNVGRTAARRVEYSAWAPVVKGFHDLSCFGYLDGLNVAYSRFLVDGTGLTFPALFVGQNRVQLSLPVRGQGRFRVSSLLREWSPAVAPLVFPPGAEVTAEAGMLPVTLTLPVVKSGVLHEAAIAIGDATTGAPVLLRAHLFKAPNAFDAALDWAVYFPSDGDAVPAVTLAVAPESAHGRLDARLVGDGGKTAKQATVKLDQPGTVRVPMSLADLVPGFYRIEIDAELTGLGKFDSELRFFLTPGPFD